MKIAVLMSSSISGGNNVIIEHFARIDKRNNGIEVVMVIIDELNKNTLKWQPLAKELPKISLNEAQNISFDVVMATFWRTVFDCYNIHSDAYLFFNQCLESDFYPQEDVFTRSYAESAYTMGLNTITEVQWLADYMKKNFDVNALVVRNGINKSYFQCSGKTIKPREKGKLRVLVEGNVTMDRKKIPLTVKLAKQSKADEIWLLTSSDINEFEGVDKVFSKVPIDQVQEIYRSCDVLVKISTMEGMFGPPLEMFHCGGTAIAWDVNGHDEYMESGFNSIIIPMYEEKAVVEAINELKDKPEKLSYLKENALKTAQNWHNWDEASLEMEKAIKESVKNSQPSQSALRHKSQLFTNWYQYSNNLSVENNNIKKKLGYKIHEKLKNITNPSK